MYQNKTLKMSKKLGQNFLKSNYYLKKITQALEINKNDIIVEIGGGNGELTKYLTQAKKLIVYEIDKKLAKNLENKFKDFKNIEIINSNFLKSNLEILNNEYKLVGNIPYSITGLIFKKILKKENIPKIFVFTIQKELGKKLLTPNNFLFYWFKIWGEVKKIDIIKNKFFFPKPKIDSMIIKIKFYSKTLVEKPEDYIILLKKLFKNKKRKIKNNIKLTPDFYELNELRPHQLKFEDILKIYHQYHKLKNEKNNLD